MMTKRVLHCWEDGPRDDDGMGTTCMLERDHDGPHEWTRDDEIRIGFAHLAPVTKPEVGGRNPPPRSGNPIKRGRMTDGERAEIERLAATMKSPTPGKIAQRLGRKVSTVNWYMLRHGLVERPLAYRAKPYFRDGRTVHPYSPDADARILTLRRQGRNSREIAEVISSEFGVQRSGHSINVRLMMLACYSDGPEGEIAAGERAAS